MAAVPACYDISSWPLCPAATASHPPRPTSAPPWANTPIRVQVGRAPYPPCARAPCDVCVLDSIAPSLPSLGRPTVVPVVPNFSHLVNHVPSLAHGRSTSQRPATGNRSNCQHQSSARLGIALGIAPCIASKSPFAFGWGERDREAHEALSNVKPWHASSKPRSNGGASAAAPQRPAEALASQQSGKQMLQSCKTANVEASDMVLRGGVKSLSIIWSATGKPSRRSRDPSQLRWPSV